MRWYRLWVVISSMSLYPFNSVASEVKPPVSNTHTSPSDDKSPVSTFNISNREIVNSSSVTVGDVTYSNVYNFTKKGQYAEVAKVEHEYDELHTFCYTSTQPTLGLFWASTSLKLDLDTTDYQLYIGPNVSTVAGLAQASGSDWFYSQLPWRSKEFKLSPFEDACIGVQTSHQYSLSLSWKHVNYLMVLATLVGLVLFWSAPNLCRNTFFHYTTGISLGVLLSVLVLTFVLQKRFKQSLFSWVGLAYSVSVYLMTRTWFNIKEWMTDQYIHWVIGYIVVAGVTSFAFVYRMGPPNNPRTLNLIQWSMQGLALLLIVMSSYHQQASVALALVVMSWAAIPASIKSAANTQIQKRFFKPKVKLLTEDQYTTQANVETQKALKQLKDYCRSPDSKPWKTVTRLQDPTRFAEFIEGSPHLTEAEVIDYSHWDYNTSDEEERDDYTDDEENTANSDNSEDK